MHVEHHTKNSEEHMSRSNYYRLICVEFSQGGVSQGNYLAIKKAKPVFSACSTYELYINIGRPDDQLIVYFSVESYIAS